MKEFLLALLVAGVSATTAWAQGLSASANSTVSVTIQDYIAIQITQGNNLSFMLTNPDQYGNPAYTQANVRFRVDAAQDNAVVTVLPQSDLTDVVSGAAIPISEVTVGPLGGTLLPLSLSMPVMVVSNLLRGTSEHDATVSIGLLDWGDYLPATYSAALSWTVTGP